jgi:hypothetical protein
MASECPYSYQLHDGLKERGPYSKDRLARLADEQPNLVLVDTAGDSVCAFVHADAAPYMVPTRSFRAEEDRAVLARLEYPAARFTVALPASCRIDNNDADDAEPSADRTEWRFEVTGNCIGQATFGVNYGGSEVPRRYRNIGYDATLGPPGSDA